MSMAARGMASPPSAGHAAAGPSYFQGFAGAPARAPAAPADGGADVYPGTECEHCGMYVYDEDDDPSESATSEEDYPVQDLPEYSNQKANELHEAYVLARRKWRSFAGKKSRFVRRPVKNGSGKSRSGGRVPGKGAAGKGVGFGKPGGVYRSSFATAYFGEGKRNKRSPAGRGGKTMRYHGCDPEENLIARCPRRPKH